MISPGEFVSALKSRDYQQFTGVPCSFFQAAINFVIDEPSLHYTIAPNEGAALAMASGTYLAGKPTAVMIQNSGLGNLMNPLTSLNMIYGIPVLVFISGRAYGISDEPQHEIIGKTMGPLLDAIGVKHDDMPDELSAYEEALDGALEWMNKKKQPFVFFVRKNSIDDYIPKKNINSRYSLKRIDAIKIIAESLKGDELVIATTGKPSRELFSVSDRRQNFYMQGSMGHAASIGLGVALSKPEKKIVVLDGDGAVLMHLGALSAIGHYKPENLCHIILDNESYETTGDQDTTSATTNLKMIAKACGYKVAEEATTEAELRSKLKVVMETQGPTFLRVKINRLPTLNIPRISSRYTSQEIAQNFKTDLLGSER